MLSKLIHYSGYALIILFGVMDFLGVMVAAIGHAPDTPAARLMARSVQLLFYAAPIWAIICYKGYQYGWLLGEYRYGWVPLTLLPLLILFIFFQIVDRAQP